MGVIRWSEEKDHWLRAERGISFQEISAQILGGDSLEHDNTIFLKTAYPSRKMHRRYGGPHGEEN